MPIRFTLENGALSTVEIDTVDEAVTFYRQVSGASRLEVQVPKRAPVPVPSAAFNVQPQSVDASVLPASVKRLLRELLQRHPKGGDGQTLAEAINIPPKGLGSLVAALAKWGKRVGLSKSDIIVKDRRRNGDGQLVRTMKLGGPFLKLVKEGKITGLG